ncbi:MAG: hypothetical protein IKR13_05380 [Victivallales bacterium]|nr:hypothetical protein [Victivallales bacterium]
MSSYHHRKALGLEYDTHGARAVVLRRRLAGWHIVDVLHLPWQQEGILTETEQQRAIREWLSDRHIGTPAACGGLTQSEVNTVISDFPPVHNRDQLARMVEYQTRQLNGLSGEQFLHAFQALIPLPGQTNPLLIAMGRETMLEKRLQHYQAMGLQIEQMTSTGLALVNAFETLQDAAAEQPCLQLVADFGTDSSVFVIYCQGRIQQITTMNIGFAPTKDVTPASLVHSFAREAQNILQGWKASQVGDSGLQAPTQLWLSGIGALNAEVAEILASDLQLPVHLLGIPARKCEAGLPTGGAIGGVCPALTLAFGLALQGTGTAPCSLSLIPERLAWQQRKCKASPYLFLAAILIALAMLTGLHFFNTHLRIANERLQEQEAELDEALRLVPQLDRCYQQLANHQRQLLPIAETGFRTQRFMETLQVWLKALPAPPHSNAETWCFYLADEFSFTQANTTSTVSGSRRGSREEDISERTTRTRTTRNTELPTGTVNPPSPKTVPALLTPESNATDESNTTLRSPQADTETPGAGFSPVAEAAEPPPPTYPAVTPVAQIPVLTAMYIGGFVPSRGNKYEIVKQMQERLNLSETFVNVDDCADFLTQGFNDSYLLPWQEFLTEHREELGQDYLLFFLQLPFREALVKRPAN